MRIVLRVFLTVLFCLLLGYATHLLFPYSVWLKACAVALCVLPTFGLLYWLMRWMAKQEEQLNVNLH